MCINYRDYSLSNQDLIALQDGPVIKQWNKQRSSSVRFSNSTSSSLPIGSSTILVLTLCAAFPAISPIFPRFQAPSKAVCEHRHIYLMPDILFFFLPFTLAGLLPCPLLRPSCFSPSILTPLPWLLPDGPLANVHHHHHHHPPIPQPVTAHSSV